MDNDFLDDPKKLLALFPLTRPSGKAVLVNLNAMAFIEEAESGGTLITFPGETGLHVKEAIQDIVIQENEREFDTNLS